MSREEHYKNIFHLTDEQLECKNPLNKPYLKNLYTYAIASGLVDEEKRKVIELPLCYVKLKEEECTKEEIDAIMIGIGNQAILEQLWDTSIELNKGTVDEAINFLVNEIRSKRQLSLQSHYVSFFGKK